MSNSHDVFSCRKMPREFIAQNVSLYGAAGNTGSPPPPFQASRSKTLLLRHFDFVPVDIEPNCRGNLHCCKVTGLSNPRKHWNRAISRHRRSHLFTHSWISKNSGNSPLLMGGKCGSVGGAVTKFTFQNVATRTGRHVEQTRRGQKVKSTCRKAVRRIKLAP